MSHHNKHLLYAFLHLPKTAGTTFCHHLRRHFWKHQLFPVYSTSAEETHRTTHDRILALTTWRRKRIRVAFGHNLYQGIEKPFGKDARYFTFMRDPIKRTFSHYNYNRTDLESGPPFAHSPPVVSGDGRILTFEEWFLKHREMHAYITSVLCEFVTQSGSPVPATPSETLATAKTALESFYFVGLTQNFEKDSAIMYQELGMRKPVSDQNVSHNYIEDDQKDRLTELVRSHTETEQELYRFAVELNHKFHKQRSMRE
ncbi:MAG: sulfotransferase family 2 domain-containing protein [Planctomycetaceae bacterium]|jgi:hypothetical protein